MEYVTMEEANAIVKNLLSSSKSSAKMEIARMYNNYIRECNQTEKEYKVREKARDCHGNKQIDIHHVIDDMYIVEYISADGTYYEPYYDGRLQSVILPTYDHALIALLALKNTGSLAATPFIFKMLDMKE